MRRSRSQSSIPVSKGKERTKSVSRTRASGSQKESLDRKMTPLLNSGVKNPYLTPNYGGIFKRSGYSSSIGKSSVRGVSPVDLKAKQLQIKDKKWVSEQYLKCQHFIKTCGLFGCASIANSIKPPTINIFVEIMSTLLEQIFPTVSMNSHNYPDVLVSHLKLLRYPGSLTSSGVKSCNTMHGFPQFIGILSWFIDKISPEEDTFPDSLELQLHKSLFIFFSVNYTPWSSGINDQPTEESVEQLCTEFSVILGLAEQNEIAKGVEILKTDIDKTEKQLETLSDTKLDLQNDMKNKQRVMDALDDDAEEDLKLDEEITKVKSKIEIQKRHLQGKEELVQSIKSQILAQPCTSKERTQLLNEIEEKKRYNARLKETASEYHRIRDEVDHELMELVLLTEKKVDAWNILVARTFLPELENLQLRTKGFHSPAFLEEIGNLKKLQLTLKRKFREEYEHLQKEIAQLLKKQESFISTAASLKEAERLMEKAAIQNERLKKEIKEAEDKFLKEGNEMKDFIDHMQQTLVSEISMQEKKLKELQLKLQQIETHFEDVAKAGVECIAIAHREGAELYRQVDELSDACLENMRNASIRERNELSQKFQIFVKLVEQLKKLG